jgi:hypothetical protein
MNKKIGMALVLALVVGGGVFALDWAAYPDSITSGKVILNAGIGFGTPLHGNMLIPPISVSADYALPLGGLPFTLGLFGGFNTSEYKLSYAGYGYTNTYTGIAIAGRFGYHPNLGVKNLDVYTDIALGYYIYSGKAEYSGYWAAGTPKPDPTDYSRFFWGLNFGARYFFANAIGAFLELGYNEFSFVTAGVSFKI